MQNMQQDMLQWRTHPDRYQYADTSKGSYRILPEDDYWAAEVRKNGQWVRLGRYFYLMQARQACEEKAQ